MKKIPKIAFLLLLSLILATVFYVYGFPQKQTNKKEIIERIMNYPIPDVIERCKKDFKYTDDDMKILEREVKRYLAMSVVLEDTNTGIGMYSKDVDNLWHSFILFTKDYAAFCDECIGRFIHHVPETDTTKTPEKMAESRNDFQIFIKNYEEIFQDEVHPIWFLDICEEKV